jgi:hypothetical protein
MFKASDGIKVMFSALAKGIKAIAVGMVAALGTAALVNAGLNAALENVPQITFVLEKIKLDAPRLANALVYATLVSIFVGKAGWDLVSPDYKARVKELEKGLTQRNTF